ncbi:tetratricopeptide repeat-containing sensor histidine kinase [Mucilaginibacter ginkgonis]|uniref:histidine kinase n=1 Tax=Mucilaginibacter ginkgonis TaxID=2682091 RepID=A0A7T7JGC6_9SPHI|nr:tetratricopeptide repeat-containing sensor histidine kinase [Mucilaginibacter ginkgonis]QQL49091.1 hypothetical protein GO620_013020 [Mucilaginibacter ginkgonis]
MFNLKLFVCLSLAGLSVNAQQSKTVSDQNKLITRYDSLISNYRYSKPDSALYYITKGLGYARQQQDIAGQALMLNQMGMMNDNQGHYPEARGNYSESFKLYQKLGAYKGMATETYRLGVVSQRMGNNDKAVAYHLSALEYSEHASDKHGIVEANLGLFEDYFSQHSYETSAGYLAVADSVNRLLPFSNLNFTIDNGYGKLLRERGQYEQAKQYVMQGLAKTNSPKYQGFFITLTNTLASIYTKEGNIAQAIVLQKQSLEKSRAINNDLRELESLFNLALSYKKLEPVKSLEYYEQAKTLALDKKSYKQVITALQGMAALYEQSGNYKAAYGVQKQQYKLADSLYYQEMSKQIAGIVSQYELNKSKLNVQRLQLITKREQLQRRIYLLVAIGIAILMGIGLLFYLRLRKINYNLANVNLVKDKLLSVFAHDLRSPFVSIINLMHIINDEDVTHDERATLLHKLEMTSKASLETLDGLLKWGQMQMKGIQVSPVQFAIKQVVQSIQFLLAETASQKNVKVFNLVSDDISLTADVDQFEFIIRNILSNAIKFSKPGGSVWILADADTAKNEVSISIRDNGVGIAADKLDQIFNLDNVSASGTANEKGTSIGLLMSKQFITANHGAIKVISQPDKGSEFLITLPIELKNA